MREIKYRVWDKQDKEWIHDKEMVYIDEDGEVHIIEEKTWAYQSYMDRKKITDDVEVVFFTGLKDKNGKGIWEGDIVKQTYEKTISVNYDPDSYGFIDSEEISGHHIGEVTVIATQGACIKNPVHYSEDEGTSEKTKQYKGIAGYRCEVLGNVFENPELLEGDANV